MNPILGPIGVAMGIFERRRMLRRVSRLSDRRLHDIGLERDWDGSILRNGRGL